MTYNIEQKFYNGEAVPINYSFTLALKALREIQAEHGQGPAPGQSPFPDLADVLEQIGSIPPDALLLGVASDGLPLLLNLRDAAPGPLLVLTDQGSSKTVFLQVLARAASRLFSADRVRYAVLTDFPDAWTGFETEPHCLGIYPIGDNSAIELLYELACQAEAGASDASALLFFDGLDSVLHINPVGQENLRYLLEYGPQAHIWPITSVNAARAATLPEWLSHFHTRIYERISHPDLAEYLPSLPGVGSNTLFPGAQFYLKQKSRWLRFWLPSL